MLKCLLVRASALVVAALLVTAGSAYAKVFHLGDLHGEWLIGVSGFELDNNDDFGELAAVGFLRFDNKGSVTQFDVTFTGADTNGTADNNFDNFTCAPTLGTGTATVNGDGTGTLALVFASSSACFASQTINFFFALNRGNRDGKIVSTTFTPTGLTIDTTPVPETILSVVLAGQFIRRDHS